MARLTSIIQSPFARWTAVFIALMISVLTVSRTWVPAYGEPISIPVELSANFGEIREGHWHMGIDIRTRGRENIPVLAVAEGYVSRLGISADGYGKVIYITHKNNRTSVYAHLNSFAPELGQFVRSRQTAMERWEQDLVLEPGRFPVNKGAMIGLSGNTGHSEGPHLHFEWRNTKTGHCINPQLELFRQQDDLPPMLEAIYWYQQLTDGSLRDGREIAMQAGNGEAIIVNTPYIVLGITAIDKINGSRFNMGVYDTRLLRDDSLIYHLGMDSIPETYSRYSDHYIDYPAWYDDKRVIQLLRIPLLPAEANNHATERPSGTDAGKRGGIDLRDQQAHRVTVELRDLRGNMVKHDLVFRYRPQQGDKGNGLNLEHVGSIQNSGQPDFTVKPAGNELAGAGNISAREIVPVARGAFFAAINIHEGKLLPVDSVTVRLRGLHIPETAMLKKLVLVVKNKFDYDVVAGTVKNGWFRANTATTGDAQVFCDTVPPKIMLGGWKNRQSLRKGDVLKILVKDNLQMIKEFRAEINGRWVAFDRKANQFTLVLDQQVPSGNDSLMIRVSDVAGNITRNVFHFQY